MADYAIHDTTLEAIANTIRKKDGTQALIDPADYADRINLMGMLEEKTVSGAIASFSDGADDVPLKSLVCNVDANLSGISSVECTQTGINLWNESWETGAISETTGANTTNNNKIRPTGLIAVKPSTSFYIVCPQLIQILFYRKDETYIGIGSGYGSSRVFTTDAETYFIRFNVANAYGNTYNNDISINFPSTDTEYNSHVTPTVSTVNLGRTIYGGQVDVVNGTCSKAITETKTFDGSDDENWLYSSSYGWFYIDNQFNDAYRNNAEDDFMGCNLGTQTKYSSVTTLPDMHFACTSGTNSRFAFKNTQYSTVEAFKEWLSNNNMIVAYTSATFTPFTFPPITPTPETKLGDNNIWCDSGDSEIVYRSSGTATIITPTLVSKTITENGTYSAEDDSADGYDEVTVDVPTFLVNDTDLKTSGQMLYSKSVTIAEADDYKVIWQSYSGAPTIQVNGVTQSMTYSNSSQYAYYYCATHTLAVGDTVSFYLNDTGNNCFVAQIMKVTQNQNRGVPIEEQEENNEEEEER